MLKKLAAVGLAAGALVLIAPTAAAAAPSVSGAVSSSYAESPGVRVGDPIIDVCEVSTIAFAAGYFLPSENVSVSVSGANAEGAAVSGNTAAADGSLTLSFRPPADGDGSYGIAFGGSRPYNATVTVSSGNDGSCANDPSAAPAGTELPLTGGGFELALTGGDVSPWIVGGGAVALVAGGVLIAAGATRRTRA